MPHSDQKLMMKKVNDENKKAKAQKSVIKQKHKFENYKQLDLKIKETNQKQRNLMYIV